ncbi:MAG: MFS transporter, partial [Candidatus Thermoplasmatota archaeon]|nr:MFS transporter [Candidatus Thermoplasmatota archaeon]
MENQPLSRVYWKNVVAAWSGWVMDGYVTSAYALVTVTVVSRLLMPPDFGLVGALFGLALISVPRIFG